MLRPTTAEDLGEDRRKQSHAAGGIRCIRSGVGRVTSPRLNAPVRFSRRNSMNPSAPRVAVAGSDNTEECGRANLASPLRRNQPAALISRRHSRDPYTARRGADRDQAEARYRGLSRTAAAAYIGTWDSGTAQRAVPAFQTLAPGTWNGEGGSHAAHPRRHSGRATPGALARVREGRIRGTRRGSIIAGG